jgi:hypothetical protein
LSETLIGKVAICSKGRPGFIIGRKELSWGLSWIGEGLDEQGGVWASRNPRVVAESLSAWVAAEIQKAVAEEREACAKAVVADIDPECCPPGSSFCEAYGCSSLHRIAAAIRSRSVQDPPVSTTQGQASKADGRR